MPANITHMVPIVNKVESESAVKQQIEYEISAYSNFLTNYLNKKFLSTLINCLVYQADLSLVVPSSNNIEIFNFLKKFVYSLVEDLKNSQDIKIPKKHYFTLLSLIKKLIDLKEDTSFSFINYENLLTNFNINDQYVENILNDIIDNQILDNNSFHKIFDSLIQEIQIYNQMQVIKSTVFKWDSFIKDSHNDSTDNNSAINWVKKFKDTIIEANSGLSELTVLEKNESATDYLIFSDKESIKESLTSIISFLKCFYRNYKTGYSLIDDNLSGLESSSVMIIAGPSNHAKSIFMLNIARSIMELNDGSEEDAYIFITLEDDINKLFKRILSIFGNYDSVVIKKLFIKASEILQDEEYINILGKDVLVNIEKILENITEASILSVTQGKKKFIIKHSAENSFSMGDAIRFIDTLELSGLKVRAMFIDYIDVMTPTTIKQSKQFINDEYVTQGMILHEMRMASRRYGIPIITITQNNRLAENEMAEMNNNLIGDSIKKVRYSDTIIMIRQRQSLDVFSQDVSSHIGLNSDLTINESDADYLKHSVIFEAKITKAKEGSKNINKFHIFNTKNLKIYDNINQMIDDHKRCTVKSNDLLNQLSIIGLSSNLDNELLDNNEDPFDNLIL